jgi:hypothetical protein
MPTMSWLELNAGPPEEPGSVIPSDQLTAMSSGKSTKVLVMDFPKAILRHEAEGWCTDVSDVPIGTRLVLHPEYVFSAGAGVSISNREES